MREDSSRKRQFDNRLAAAQFPVDRQAANSSNWHGLFGSEDVLFAHSLRLLLQCYIIAIEISQGRLCPPNEVEFDAC